MGGEKLHCGYGTIHRLPGLASLAIGVGYTNRSLPKPEMKDCHMSVGHDPSLFILESSDTGCAGDRIAGPERTIFDAAQTALQAFF